MSDRGATTTSILVPPPPINPKTTINISGNAKVKITADGLLVIDLKLAFAKASVAFV